MTETPKKGIQHLERPVTAIQNEILVGLLAPSKYISSKFFYDHKGSELFQKITELEEYYPTKTEISILEQDGGEICQFFLNKSIIELGSGDATKISLLIDQLNPDQLRNCVYCPVDVSQSAVESTSNAMKKRFPELEVHGFVADFIHHLDAVPVEGPKAYCFFGSTLGNFTTEEAVQMLQNIRRKMNVDDVLLLGLDRVKDEQIIKRAYNDSLGITAAFNKNVLSHVNHLIEADFDPVSYEHQAVYNAELERIEMYLVAKNDHEVDSPFLDHPLRIESGEKIHTENSHKYSQKGIKKLLTSSDLKQVNSFSDSNNWFSLLVLTI